MKINPSLKSEGYTVLTFYCNFEEKCRKFSYTSKCSHKSEAKIQAAKGQVILVNLTQNVAYF